MPIKCPKCQADMVADTTKDYLSCIKCGNWTRHYSLIYEYVLKLEKKIKTLEEKSVPESNDREA